jgi:hypothetical protein
VCDSASEGAQQLTVAPDGTVRRFAQGLPLRVPNGSAFDAQRKVVVVDSGVAAILTFAPVGRLLRAEQAAQRRSDGLVIMAYGTKYANRVFGGVVSRPTS